VVKDGPVGGTQGLTDADRAGRNYAHCALGNAAHLGELAGRYEATEQNIR
jgi:hypothetical protein